MIQLPALDTLLTVALLAAIAAAVAVARGRYGIKAPAVAGHPVFERLYRVQMNTLENTVMFLPALWLAARYGNPSLAGIFGLVWIAARVGYAFAYVRRPASRGKVFGLSVLAWAAIMLQATIGVIRLLLLPG